MESLNKQAFLKKYYNQKGEVIDFYLKHYVNDVYLLQGQVKKFDVQKFRVYRSENEKYGQQEILKITDNFYEALELYVELVGFIPTIYFKEYQKIRTNQLQTA